MNHNRKYIDIHSHVLFKVDDGAGDIQKSLKMLEQAVDLNIEHLVATPHATELVNAEMGVRWKKHFDQLSDLLLRSGLPVKLSLASELFFSEQIYGWLQYPWATFADNKKYLLFELALFDLPEKVGDFIFKCRLKEITPILAHPERYIYLHDKPEKIFSWYRQGCLMQMNAGSLTGQFGGEVAAFAKKLMRCGIFHFVASDAHDTRYRSYKVIPRSFEAAAEFVDTGFLNTLYYDNPRKAIAGQPIEQAPVNEDLMHTGLMDKALSSLKKWRKVLKYG